MDSHDAHRTDHRCCIGADTFFPQCSQVTQKARQTIVFTVFVAVGQTEELLQILQPLGSALHSSEDRAQEQPFVNRVQKSAQCRGTGKITERIQLSDKFGGLWIAADGVVNTAVPVPSSCQSQIVGRKAI